MTESWPHLTQNRGLLARYLDVDAVPVRTGFSARVHDFVVGRGGLSCGCDGEAR
jgi:hypothetical protein